MNSGENCPDCHVELGLMSTFNQWKLQCPACKERFNWKLRRMDLEEPLVFDSMRTMKGPKHPDNLKRQQ